jgi:hypothetical protein
MTGALHISPWMASAIEEAARRLYPRAALALIASPMYFHVREFVSTAGNTTTTYRQHEPDTARIVDGRRLFIYRGVDDDRAWIETGPDGLGSPVRPPFDLEAPAKPRGFRGHASSMAEQPTAWGLIAVRAGSRVARPSPTDEAYLAAGGLLLLCDAPLVGASVWRAWRGYQPESDLSQPPRIFREAVSLRDPEPAFWDGGSWRWTRDPTRVPDQDEIGCDVNVGWMRWLQPASDPGIVAKVARPWQEHLGERARWVAPRSRHIPT